MLVSECVGSAAARALVLSGDDDCNRVVAGLELYSEKEEDLSFTARKQGVGAFLQRYKAAFVEPLRLLKNGGYAVFQVGGCWTKQGTKMSFIPFHST